MSDLDIVYALDYSHAITTARVHCLELFSLCHVYRPSTALELGAGYGVSGVAIGLCGVSATVIDSEEIPRSIPIGLWKQYGIRKSYIKSDVWEWLVDARGRFDLIFHDAGHGNGAIPEYVRCWELTEKILAIHDVDQFDYRAFVRGLTGVAVSGLTFDEGGRALGYCIKSLH